MESAGKYRVRVQACVHPWGQGLAILFAQLKGWAEVRTLVTFDVTADVVRLPEF